ncbi:MAG: anthranilate synthase component I family protein [Gemmatimonadaceae bacterium]|nr:anthranilate synthase component I family protein [Chitinophagaceae bacterium]
MTTTTFSKFPIINPGRVKQQMLSWIDQFHTACLLDSNHYNLSYRRFECIAAAGSADATVVHRGANLESLEKFLQDKTGWFFGHLAYDLKNEIEALNSAHPDNIGFDDLHFFIPSVILRLSENSLEINSATQPAAEIFDAILSTPLPGSKQTGGIQFTAKFSREEYIETVEKLREHIRRGDCYEINFCQEFFAEAIAIDPVSTYLSLSENSPNPFAGFYKQGEKFLLCASPERYLKKEKNSILTQPIKGTSPRAGDRLEDEANRERLFRSSKDRSENVMVVDLVRSDLAKIAEEGSVVVEELYGVYSFPHVHQMISTIKGIVKEGTKFTDIIRATFPMGSMTGAPKKKVMELIEKYERTRRGLFSGAIGYISDEGDFDFNVVIRSILYNRQTGYLSYQVGSGITFYSDPEQEYEECLLKAAAIKKVLA